MSTIQELLDQSANMPNNDFRKIIYIEIVARRGHEAPACWGYDDCSTNVLVRCPWRIDCGEKDENTTNNN